MNINSTHATIFSNTANQEIISKRIYNERQAVRQNVNDLVEISEDALERFEFQILDGEWRRRLEDQHNQNQKEWEESGAVVQNVEKRIIPNIQLNDRLVHSLSESSEEVINAAHRIINDNLLLHDGAMSEEERMELLSLGIEKAKYLSDHYMTKEKAMDFMSAIDRIARIGVNGGVNQNGVIRYNIPQGPLVGAPDHQINEFDVMKAADASAWNEYSTLMSDAVKNGDKEKMVAAMKYALDWSKRNHKANPGIFEDQQKRYSDWKKSMDTSKLPKAFEGIDRTTQESFLSSASELVNYIDKERLAMNIKTFFVHLDRIELKV